MKSKLSFILFTFLPVFILAQNSGITIEELKDHMYYLASDNLQGRLPGEEGYNKAAEYAVSQFNRSGLKPMIVDENGDSTYLQRIPFEKYTWDVNNTITLKNKKNKHVMKQSENFIILQGKPYDQTKIEGEIVFVSAGIREPEYGIDNYANVDVKGKWVITYFEPEWLSKFLPEEVMKRKYTDRETHYNIILKNAIDGGAIGVIGIVNKKMLSFFPIIAQAYKTHTKAKDIDDFLYIECPLIVLDSLFTTSLFSEYKLNPFENDTIYKSFKIPKTKISLNKNVQIFQFNSYNIIGMYEGSEPYLKDEYITLGAHLDHVGTMQDNVFNGADDNASGSIGVMEIAEELSRNSTKHPVIFLLYTAEEKGLLGSKYFVSNPPVPLSNIKVNVNLDMISRPDGDVEKGIAPIYADKINENLKNVILETLKKFPLIELDWTYADTTSYSSSSDHYSFHEKNIPAVFFFSGEHSDYHGLGDDPEKIDYEFFRNNCQFVNQLVHELANKGKLILEQQ